MQPETLQIKTMVVAPLRVTLWSYKIYKNISVKSNNNDKKWFPHYFVTQQCLQYKG